MKLLILLVFLAAAVISLIVTAIPIADVADLLAILGAV